jgi:hypothetical protein
VFNARVDGCGRLTSKKSNCWYTQVHRIWEKSLRWFYVKTKSTTGIGKIKIEVMFFNGVYTDRYEYV